MAKVRIEYVRLLRGGDAGDADPEIIALNAGAAVELVVGGASVLAPAAPAFPDGVWQSGIHARIIGLAGAVIIEIGDNTVVADGAGGNLVVQGGKLLRPIEAGQRIAAIEAPAAVDPGYVAAAPPTVVTATILNTASLSDAVQVDGKLVGFIVPAAWTAAGLSFAMSPDNVAWSDVYDGGVERTIASANVVANHFLSLQLGDWLGMKFIKFRSGAAGAVVPQLGDRAIKLLVAG